MYRYNRNSVCINNQENFKTDNEQYRIVYSRYWKLQKCIRNY